MSRCSVKMTILRRLPDASNISGRSWRMPRELDPLGVGARGADPGGQGLEAGDALDLETELLDRARGRRDIDRLLLELLGLLGGRLLVVLELVLDVGIRGGIIAPVDTYKIIVKELDIKGEISQIPYDWLTAIHLVNTRAVDPKPLVTHVYPLDKWREAFDLAATSSECLRVALKP